MSENLSRSVLWKWSICIILALVCFLIPEGEIYTYQVKLFFVITVFSLALIAFELHFAFCWIRRWNDICFCSARCIVGPLLVSGLACSLMRALPKCCF